MKKVTSRMISFLIVVCLAAGIITPAAYAEETTDDAVSAVIAQLEAIDTLQEMQDKRSSYTASGRYDIDTTDTAVITAHETARTQYETYVNQMFSARAAAQQAYDALTDAQKAQIDSVLVAKLSNDLPTVFKTGTYTVTPRDDAYTFEAVRGETGLGYEVSNHMVSGNIPQTFVLVDTSDGKTTWTPSGKYVYGESNYDVTYCCDVQTPLEYGTDYKRVNLEDSNYYGSSAAQRIRAILQNSYPFVSIEQMKANLKAGGLDAEFVDDLTRADIISAVQMAVWTYANAGESEASVSGYFATIDVPKNTGIYFTPLHDYTNECWDWLPGKRQRTYDARAAYRVNNLAYYLCNLEGVAPEDDQIVISDVKVTRADLVLGTDDTYNIGMYVYLNDGVSEQDDLTVTITSYQTNADGSTNVTAKNAQVVGGRSALEMSIRANSGDTIKVVVEGTQKLAKGVYFYEPEGGRDVSQCLVGVAEGETRVHAEETFAFVESMGEMGLRIYKSETDTGFPLSDITFTVYKAVSDDGAAPSEVPTAEEIEQYATEANKVGSVTTDATGYAAITLENGTYLVVEEYNEEKIKAPVSPFYITVPMTATKSNEDGTTSVETVNVVSIYPKNEPVVPPEEPPILPPITDDVAGKFEILKHDADDSSIVLAGAEFEVYRAATADDADAEMISCNGMQHTVIPVMADGQKMVLTTDENGRAVSPDLPCDIYFLVETKAPTGYHLLDEAIAVTVMSNTMTATTQVAIPNQKGSLLPETGGVGTTWFLLFGGILMISAAALLIVRRRKSFSK